MPTPFKDGEVDRAAIRGNVRRWIAAGLGGVVAVGTNGEAPLLDDDECEAIVETARQEVPGDRTLIAGAGRESTRATIAAARRAAAAGADAVLIRTPSFYRANVPVTALVAHYTAVADASPVPVLLYNYAAFTGVNLTPETIGRLAAHPNIVGIKESGGDVGQIAAFVEAGRDAEFSVLAGSARTFHAALRAGATGGILALASVVPDASVRVFELARAGADDEARALQQRLTPLAEMLGSTYGVPGLKAALNLSGFDVGYPRAPLAPLPEEHVARLRDALHTFQEIPV